MSNRNLGKIPGNKFQFYDPSLIYYGWTPERDELFARLWAQESPRLIVPEIARILRVTTTAAWAHAKHLGLPPRGRYRGRGASNREMLADDRMGWWKKDGREDALRHCWDVLRFPASCCAKRLQTTRSAVCAKARRLGLSKRAASRRRPA